MNNIGKFESNYSISKFKSNHSWKNWVAGILMTLSLVGVIFFMGVMFASEFISKDPVVFNENDKMNEETYAMLVAINEWTKAHNADSLNHSEYVNGLTLLFKDYRDFILKSKDDIRSDIRLLISSKDEDSPFHFSYSTYQEIDYDLSVCKKSGRVMHDRYYYSGDSKRIEYLNKKYDMPLHGWMSGWIATESPRTKKEIEESERYLREVERILSKSGK
jgi:hypothetical protein